MTSLLLKNETIDLSQHFKTPLKQFSIAVDWASISIFGRNFLGFKTKKVTDQIDLGLTCVMFDKQNRMLDLVCSSKFNSWLIKNSFPLGKSISKDKAFRHFDHGSVVDSLYKQMTTVDLQNVDSEIDHVFFYLCFDHRKVKSPDFSSVELLKMMSFGSTSPDQMISEYTIPTQNFCKKNEGILILAKLYREDEKWKFTSLGKAITESTFIRFTKGIQ